MNQATPNITIPVDVTNPGQFFACCGLLELADRLWPGTEGWFEDGAFYIDHDIVELIAKLRLARHELVEMPPTELKARNDGKVAKDPKTIQPIIVHLDGGLPITLDWWLRPSDHQGLKLWSGSNSLGAFVEDAFNAIRADGSANILRTPIQLARQPFFYAATRPLHEQHFGVSMDKLKLDKRQFQHFPYVELLAIIGLQRSRPTAERRGLFRYCSWEGRLPSTLASVVVGGAIPALIHQTFRFPVLDRDDNGHKQFTQAERIPNA